MASLIIQSEDFSNNIKKVSRILEHTDNIYSEELMNLKDLDKLDNLENLYILDKSKVTICLNMIVRNESKIITRLLTSVLPIIDTYVICDTGSTDDTQKIIKEFFDKHNIKGDVISEPFKNFGYNRTVALKAARNKATYALLLDADMIFKI